MGVKRAKDSAFGGVWWLGVIDRVHEEGQTEDVGEKDEFLRVIQSVEE